MHFVILYCLVSIACLISDNGKRRRSRIIACFLIFCGMQILLGLRHIQYGGVDTQVYARDFMRIVNQHYSFIDIFRYFYKDFGFYLFAKIFSLFSQDMNAWLFVCALPFTAGVSRLIYKYSGNIFLSFIMFLSYGYYLYNFQLVRHVFALGIIILAYKYLEEEQYKKYFVTVAVATFCHTIAILFLGAYFLRKGKITFKQIVWILLGGLIVLVLSQRSVLIAVFSAIPFLSSGRFEQFATRGGGFDSQTIFQLFFVVVSWVFLYGKGSKNNDQIIIQENSIIKKRKHKGKLFRNRINISNKPFVLGKQTIELQFNMAVVATLLYLLTIAIAESYRMAQYFSLFTILLVPNALKKAPKSVRIIIELVIILFGIRHFFGGLFVEGSAYYPYIFFWEKAQSLY